MTMKLSTARQIVRKEKIQLPVSGEAVTNAVKWRS